MLETSHRITWFGKAPYLCRCAMLTNSWRRNANLCQAIKRRLVKKDLPASPLVILEQIKRWKNKRWAYRWLKFQGKVMLNEEPLRPLTFMLNWINSLKSTLRGLKLKLCSKNIKDREVERLWWAHGTLIRTIKNATRPFHQVKEWPQSMITKTKLI